METKIKYASHSDIEPDVALLENIDNNYFLEVKSLTDFQIKKIKTLALKFAELEIIAVIEIKKQQKILEKRIHDKDDWLQDFEIITRISCRINESDMFYKDGFDNIICSVPDSMLCYDPSKNWNEFKDTRIKDDFHCGMFHYLYSNMDMDWTDILRIDNLWLDINVYHQKYDIKI